MMVKCPECGHDNQLGAIFCHNCGAKLNIEELTPEVKDTSSGIGIFKLLRKLITTVLLLGLIGVLIGLFVQAGLATYEPLTEEEETAVTEKCDVLLKRLNNESNMNQYVFTPQEATFAYNETFIKKSEAGEGEEEEQSTYLIDDVFFDIDDQNQVVVVLETRLGGKIPARFEIRGNIVSGAGDEEGVEEGDAETEGEETGEEVESPAGGIKLEITSAKMGHIPIPGFLQDKIVEKFDPVYNGGGNLEKMMQELKSIRVNDEGSFVINLKEEK